MSSSALSNVQVKSDFKNNAELFLVVPDVVLGGWELIDFAYHKSSALPVTITLSWDLNNQVSFKLREEVNFILNDLFFQINKDMDSAWRATLKTVGAAGNAFDHWAAITYR